MRSAYEWVAFLVNERPKAVAVFSLVMLIVAFFGTGLLTMQTGMETYLDTTSERGILLDNYQDTFKSDMIMVLVESDGVFTPDLLSYLDRLMEDLANEAYVQQTASIADLLAGTNGGTVPTSYAEIVAAKSAVPAAILNQYAPSNLMTIGLVTLVPGTSQETKNKVLDNMESVIALSNPPSGVQVTLTGDPAYQKEMSEEMGSSMGVLIAGAMVLMVLAVGVLFAQVRYRFLPVAIVAAGLVMTFGIMGLAGIQISMVVIGAFPVLIGIGIDYAIQFHSRLDEEIRKSPLPEAIHTTITQSGPAILYAMISTSLGFIAMWIAPIPMVRDFGVICVIGVVCCYLAALIAVPTFAVLVRYRPRSSGGGSLTAVMERYDHLLGNLAINIAKKPVFLLLVVGVVAFVGIQLDAQIPINSDEESFVPPDMPAIIDLNKVRRTMGSTDSLPIYIRGDDVLGIPVINWIDKFQDYEVSHSDKVTSATSIVTYLKAYNGGTLPDTDAEVAAALARIPETTKAGYVSGGMETIIEFSLVDLENDAALSLVRQVEGDLKWNSAPPGITPQITGMLEMFSNLLGEIAESKTRMTLLGFGLIFGFLLVVYRKISAVSPIIPIILIVGWNGAIMFLLGIDYSPLTAVLGSMSIGVASEYTILIMERYQEERGRGRDIHEAIRLAVQKIGTAITVSGMTTIFGFSALLLSSFNIIKNFGVVTVITVAFSLTGAIVVMPAVLSLMGRISEWRIGDVKDGV